MIQLSSSNKIKGRKLQHSIGADYFFECSALTQYNIDNMFETIEQHILEQNLHSPSTSNNTLYNLPEFIDNGLQSKHSTFQNDDNKYIMLLDTLPRQKSLKQGLCIQTIPLSKNNDYNNNDYASRMKHHDFNSRSSLSDSNEFIQLSNNVRIPRTRSIHHVKKQYRNVGCGSDEPMITSNESSTQTIRNCTFGQNTMIHDTGMTTQVISIPGKIELQRQHTLPDSWKACNTRIVKEVKVVEKKNGFWKRLAAKTFKM